jgi:hypothetical protein
VAVASLEVTEVTALFVVVSLLLWLGDRRLPVASQR